MGNGGAVSITSGKHLAISQPNYAIFLYFCTIIFYCITVGKIIW